VGSGLGFTRCEMRALRVTWQDLRKTKYAAANGSNRRQFRRANACLSHLPAEATAAVVLLFVQHASVGCWDVRPAEGQQQRHSMVLAPSTQQQVQVQGISRQHTQCRCLP